MSSNHSSSDSRSTSTAAPTQTARPAAEAQREQDAPKAEAGAAKLSVVEEAKGELSGAQAAEKAGVSFKKGFTLTSFPEQSHGHGHGQKAKHQQHKGEHGADAPVGTLAASAKDADVIGRETVDALTKNSSFKSHVVAAEVHQQLKGTRDARVVVEVDNKKEGVKDEIRDQLNKLFGGQDVKSIEKFITPFDGDAGSGRTIKPTAEATKDRDSYIDWMAKHIADGNGMKIRSRDFATTSALAATLAGDQNVKVGKEGYELREVNAQASVQNVGRELLGLNGAQNQAITGPQKQHHAAEALVGRSDALRGVKEYSESLERERPGILTGTMAGQFLSASKGKTDEKEIGDLANVFYPSGKPVITMLIPGQMPKSLEQISVKDETAEVAIEFPGAKSQKKASVLSDAPAAAAERPRTAEDVVDAMRQAQQEAAAAKNEAAKAAPAKAVVAKNDQAQTAEGEPLLTDITAVLKSVAPNVVTAGRIPEGQGAGEVIQMANLTRFTGRVELRGESRAMLSLKDGEVQAIRTDKENDAAAISEVALGNYKKFAFVAGEPSQRSMPTEYNNSMLLLEMARIRDETARQALEVPAPEAKQEQAPVIAKQPAGVSPDQA